MSSQTTPNSSRPATSSSLSPSALPMASFATLQSTYTTTPTVYSSTTQLSPLSVLKPLKRFFGSSDPSQAALLTESKAEKKQRRRSEQEARLTPEELKLANLMTSYGDGSAPLRPAGSFTGKY